MTASAFHDLLQREAQAGDVLHDWEVTHHPDGTIVKAWTKDTYAELEQSFEGAQVLLGRLLSVGNMLGQSVSGGMEVSARRDGPDEEWRGYMMVVLSAPDSEADAEG